jgi:hypothetical protein
MDDLCTARHRIPGGRRLSETRRVVLTDVANELVGHFALEALLDRILHHAKHVGRLLRKSGASNRTMLARIPPSWPDNRTLFTGEVVLRWSEPRSDEMRHRLDRVAWTESAFPPRAATGDGQDRWWIEVGEP